MSILTRNSVKAAVRAAHKDSKSRKCQAAVPAVCRFHGLPQPVSQTSAKQLAEKASQDLNSQRFDIYIEAKLDADENFKRYIAGGENGFPSFAKAKPLMEKIYTPGEVNESNFKKLQDEAYKERLQRNTTYLNSLATQMFQGDKSAMFIAQHGTKDAFSLRQARKNKYPVVYAGEDRLAVDSFAAEHGMSAGLVEDGTGHQVYVPINEKAYPISDFTQQQLIDSPKFSQQFFAYKEAEKRVRNGQSLSDVSNLRSEFATVSDGIAAGRSL